MAKKYQLIKSKIEHFVILVNASSAENHFLFRLIFHIFKKVPDFQKTFPESMGKNIYLHNSFFSCVAIYTR